MLRQIGYTKNAHIIFQDFRTGDVTVKRSASDEMGFFYPFEEWEQKKDQIAETITEEYDPDQAYYSLEELQEQQKQKLQAIKAATHLLSNVLVNILRR